MARNTRWFHKYTESAHDGGAAECLVSGFHCTSMDRTIRAKISNALGEGHGFSRAAKPQIRSRPRREQTATIYAFSQNVPEHPAVPQLDTILFLNDNCRVRRAMSH
jgi:hypothetical protein